MYLRLNIFPEYVEKRTKSFAIFGDVAQSTSTKVIIDIILILQGAVRRLYLDSLF